MKRLLKLLVMSATYCQSIPGQITAEIYRNPE